jgi:carboxyl-terminal processing protease
VIKVKGPKGTPVRLLVGRDGETVPLEITIIRAEIQLPSVFSEMRGDIAHIRIAHFTERTAEELGEVLAELPITSAGIILDLRSNPGGLLDAVVDVASYFIPEGIIVQVVDNAGAKSTASVKPGKTVTDLPVVMLVDSYSASGSEVLAGAFKDYERAVIAGVQTFGKGSVNHLYELADGSGLYLTVARWFTPDGLLIEGEGIIPDEVLEIEMTGDEPVLWALDFLGNNS